MVLISNIFHCSKMKWVLCTRRSENYKISGWRQPIVLKYKNIFCSNLMNLGGSNFRKKSRFLLRIGGQFDTLWHQILYRLHLFLKNEIKGLKWRPSTVYTDHSKLGIGGYWPPSKIKVLAKIRKRLGPDAMLTSTSNFHKMLIWSHIIHKIYAHKKFFLFPWCVTFLIIAPNSSF